MARAAGVRPLFDYADEDSYLVAGTFDAVFDAAGSLSVGQGLAMLNPGGVFVDINPTPRRIARGMLSGRYKLVFATMGFNRLADVATLAGEGVLRPRIGVAAPFCDALATIAQAETGARNAGRTVMRFAR